MGRVGLTPNALTLIGFAGTCVAAVAVGFQAWTVAGVLVLVFGVFDMFDGTLARATGKASRLGAFMDSVFDRWGEGIVYVGIVAGCVAGRFWEGALLAAAAMASAFMVSYARAKSEGLGFTEGTGMAAVGLAPREIRLVILTGGLILTGLSGGVSWPELVGMPDFPSPQDAPGGQLPLMVSLGLITILATITVIQRVIHVINQYRQQENSNQ
jgi:phosphatidylglycerophosphate synthase